MIGASINDFGVRDNEEILLFNTGMVIVIGLGNPGTSHARNRHNVGFMVLDEVAARAGISFEKKKIFYSHIAETGEFLFVKPDTFMNHTGTAATLLVREFQSPLIVVYDDITVSLGEVKCSYGRGSGDHNGVQSVIDSLGHKDFFRIRVGVRPIHDALLPRIAPPDGFEKFLLSDVTPMEEEQLREGINKAVLIIEDLAKKSFDQIMNEYN